MLRSQNIMLVLLSFIFSLTLIAWDSKEQFDSDFKAAVSKFLNEKNKTVLLNSDFDSFVQDLSKFFKEYNKFCEYDPNNPNVPWRGVMRDIPALKDTGRHKLDTFFCVGSKKSLSNLPTRSNYIDKSILLAIEKWTQKMGYEIYLKGELNNGTLWVYSPQALGKLLNQNAGLLEINKVSKNPRQFVEEISKKDSEGKSPFDLGSGNSEMFQLIARAFGREISLEDIKTLISTILK